MRLDEISAALRALDEADLLRQPDAESDLAARQDWVDFASNDYLGLAPLGVGDGDVSRETLLGPAPGAPSDLASLAALSTAELDGAGVNAAELDGVGVNAAELDHVPLDGAQLEGGQRFGRAQLAGVAAASPLLPRSDVSRATSERPGAALTSAEPAAALGGELAVRRAPGELASPGDGAPGSRSLLASLRTMGATSPDASPAGAERSALPSASADQRPPTGAPSESAAPDVSRATTPLAAGLLGRETADSSSHSASPQASWGESAGPAGPGNSSLGLYPRTLHPEGVRAGSAGSRGWFSGGAGASRLVFGTHSAHLAAEADLANWLGYEAALLFSSGYAANVGALGALLSEGDCVLSDELNHASLIDGIRLSRARPTILPHLDLGALERALKEGQGAPARWVVLESYSSMDGDGPDLVRVRGLCDRYDAYLYLDEAHGVGLFGPAGRGRAAEVGVRADVLMAGLGKAVGAQGGAVLGSAELRTWLWNRARSFVFSTAPAPLTATTLSERITRVRSADAERARVHALAASVRRRLTDLGFDLGSGSFGPILGLRLGQAERALRWGAALRSAGFLAQAIRPPTVPANSSRLRLTLRASHQSEDLERLLACLTALRDGERAP